MAEKPQIEPWQLPQFAERCHFAQIELTVYRPDENFEDTCVTVSTILSKKTHLAAQLGPPENQTWYVKATGQLMENDKTFAYYGAQEDGLFEINVQISD